MSRDFTELRTAAAELHGVHPEEVAVVVGGGPSILERRPLWHGSPSERPRGVLLEMAAATDEPAGPEAALARALLIRAEKEAGERAAAESAAAAALEKAREARQRADNRVAALLVMAGRPSARGEG